MKAMISIFGPASRLFAGRCLVVGAAVAAVLAPVQKAWTATITKANNADTLNLASSWTDGVLVPGAADIALWDGTVTGPNSAALGSDLSWKGIVVTNAGGAVTIGTGNTLTLGTSGVTLSSNQNLVINSGLTLGTGHQVWNVATNGALTLGTGQFTRGTAATLAVQGPGVVTPANLANGTGGILGTWATYGTGQNTRYAAVSGGNITSFSGNSVADVTLATNNSGTNVYSAGGAGGALGSTNLYALRYYGSGAAISGNFTANGLLNAGTGTLTNTGVVTIGSNKEFVVNCAYKDIVLAGAVGNNSGGASSLVKNGGNQLIVGNGSAIGNSYSGGTWINQGTLQLKDSVGTNALGAGDVFVASGAVLFLRPGSSLPNNKVTIAGTGTGSSAPIYVASSTPTLGSLALSGDAVIGSDNGGAGLTVNGGVDLGSNTLTIGGTVSSSTITETFKGVVAGTGGITFNASGLTSGSATLKLSAANTYSGDTVLKVKASATGIAQIQLNHVLALQNSTLDLDVEDAQKYMSFVVAGTNTYFLGGLKGADTLNINYNTINVGGNGQNTTYAGAIINKSGVGSVIKSGSGIWTLTGANTYSGSTTISNGTLALSGSGSIASTSITNYGTFDVSTVYGGYHLLAGTTLMGTGSVVGPMVVDAGATLTVGGSSGTVGLGTMAVTGDLTLTGNTVLRLNKGGTSDRITATGTLTLGGNLEVDVVGGRWPTETNFRSSAPGVSGA